MRFKTIEAAKGRQVCVEIGRRVSLVPNANPIPVSNRGADHGSDGKLPQVRHRSIPRCAYRLCRICDVLLTIFLFRISRICSRQREFVSNVDHTNDDHAIRFDILFYE